MAVGISKDAGMGDKEGQGDIMFICNQVKLWIKKVLTSVGLNNGLTWMSQQY